MAIDLAGRGPEETALVDPAAVVKMETVPEDRVAVVRTAIVPDDQATEIGRVAVIDPDALASGPTGLATIVRGIQGRVAIDLIALAMAIDPDDPIGQAMIGGTMITSITALVGPIDRARAASTIVGRDPIARAGTTGTAGIPIAARGGTTGATTFVTTGAPITTTTIGSPPIGGTCMSTTSAAGITATASTATRTRTGGPCRPTRR
jgi:hypothetical protein